jgi:hypothetical protein
MALGVTARNALVAIAAAALVLLGAPRLALAWVEVHVGSDDVRITLDRDGKARVEHRLVLRVAGGPLPSFSLRGVDADAAVEADGYAVLANAATRGSLTGATPIQAELLPPGPSREGRPEPLSTLQIQFEGRGLARGAYLVLVRYRTDLAARGLVSADGAVGQVRWIGPTFDDGLEGATITFDLPAAPTEPRAMEAIVDDDPDLPAPTPPTVVSTIQRGPERDELSLLRPYAPKGEPLIWAVQTDARAVSVPAPTPSAAAPKAPPMLGALLPSPGVGLWLSLAAMFAVVSALVAAKSLEVARVSREAGSVSRPVVPWPIFVRAIGAGLCLSAGVAAQFVFDKSTLGALLVGLAVLFAAHRTPLAPRSRRGPGKWLPISMAEAFRAQPRPKGIYFDVSSRAGKVCLVLALAALGGVVFVLAKASPYHAYVASFDGVMLLAIFATGRLDELSADPALRPIPFLKKLARLIETRAGAHVKLVAKLRIPKDQADPDELRLTLVPKRPRAGWVAIEIGMVYAHGAGGSIALPEVLVRMVRGSACDEAFRDMARHGRVLRGRRADELVLAFTPRLPMANLVAKMAVAIAIRATDPSRPTGSERGKSRQGARQKGSSSSSAISAARSCKAA